jgi:hypothetical protein
LKNKLKKLKFNYLGSNQSLKLNSNNNSVGNVYDDYWNDKQRSPDTSENFAMKIENFSKKEKEEKPRHRINKEKINKTKNTKTIINVPNANFEKSNNSNISIPKPPKGNILNNKFPGDNNKVPFHNAFDSLNINSNIIDNEDDTNEGIPIENNNLINFGFKSVNINNNNLSDINSRNLRMNTEDNSYFNNDKIYQNLLVSPNKNIKKNINQMPISSNNNDNKINTGMPMGNFNNINSKIIKIINYKRL